MKRRYYISYDYKDTFGNEHMGELEEFTEEAFIKSFLELIYSKPIRVLYTSTVLHDSELIDNLFTNDFVYYEKLKEKYLQKD